MVLRYVGPCWCHGGPGTGCGPCCQRTCGHDPHPYAGSGSRTCWRGRRSDEQYRWISTLYKTEIHPLVAAVVDEHMHAQVTHSSCHSSTSMRRYLMVFTNTAATEHHTLDTSATDSLSHCVDGLIPPEWIRGPTKSLITGWLWIPVSSEKSAVAVSSFQTMR